MAVGRAGVADWQLVLHSDGSFDYIFEAVRGDSGTHTIGFHNSTDGHMVCYGSGEECTLRNTQFHVAGPEDNPLPIIFTCDDQDNGNYSCTYDVTDAGAYL
eukprot:SAG11_NODE_24759_length_368_cov_1.156134_1_plen_100_part_01